MARVSDEEKEVLKTFKSGLGLTSVEQEILLNYIEKLQKENQELKEKLDYYSYYKEKESQEFDERDYWEE